MIHLRQIPSDIIVLLIACGSSYHTVLCIISTAVSSFDFEMCAVI